MLELSLAQSSLNLSLLVSPSCNSFFLLPFTLKFDYFAAEADADCSRKSVEHHAVSINGGQIP